MNERAASAPRTAGARYEDIACAHLQRAGLTLLARNFHCRYGEIDLIMRERDVVVFVEVRYRRAGVAGTFGDGVDSVSTSKRARLVRAAGMFLAQHAQLASSACRFDVIAVAGDAAAPRLDWRPNAFEAT
jgi:putative endonuclease